MRDSLGVVVRLVAFGQPDHFLGVERLLAAAYQARIGDEVVHVGAPHRPGEAKVVDLQRRRAMGEDAGTKALCEAVEIDCDIDTRLTCHAGDLGVTAIADLDEMIEGLADPATQPLLSPRSSE